MTTANNYSLVLEGLDVSDESFEAAISAMSPELVKVLRDTYCQAVNIRLAIPRNQEFPEETFEREAVIDGKLELIRALLTVHGLVDKQTERK
jgi:hypothetical protein